MTPTLRQCFILNCQRLFSHVSTCPYLLPLAQDTTANLHLNLPTFLLIQIIQIIIVMILLILLGDVVVLGTRKPETLPKSQPPTFTNISISISLPVPSHPSHLPILPLTLPLSLPLHLTPSLPLVGSLTVFFLCV